VLAREDRACPLLDEIARYHNYLRGLLPGEVEGGRSLPSSLVSERPAWCNLLWEVCVQAHRGPLELLGREKIGGLLSGWKARKDGNWSHAPKHSSEK